MSRSPEIFVKLLDEGVDVWKPVKARLVRGGVYVILEQPYDRQTEHWEFEPGDEVFAELTDFEGGRFLSASRRTAP